MIVSIFFKIISKITINLIPIFTRFKMYNILSLIFILNLRSIKQIAPNGKIKYKVIVLRKSAGIDDLLCIPKNKNILFLKCQRLFFKKIHFTILKTKDIDKLNLHQTKILENKYLDFLIHFLKNLRKKYGFNAFIGFNYNYPAEKKLHVACSKLNIPFLILYKEGLQTDIERKYVNNIKQKSNLKFNGYKMSVYSNILKKNLINIKYINKNKIEVVGCSRLILSYKYRNIKPDTQILYYAIQKDRGLPNQWVNRFGNKFFSNLKDHKNYNAKINWNILHLKTVKVLKDFALINPGINIIIKVKTGFKKVSAEYSNLPKNIKVIWDNTGHELLKKSKIVIGWNSTSILEAIAANRFILLPYFHVKNKKFKKSFELKLKLKNENYAYSEEDFYEKLNFFTKKKYLKNRIYNNQFSLKYYLGNKDGKAHYRLYEFIKSSLKK